jgi:hypothetical protein
VGLSGAQKFGIFNVFSALTVYFNISRTVENHIYK